jgi:hypothetical protein
MGLGKGVLLVGGCDPELIEDRSVAALGKARSVLD